MNGKTQTGAAHRPATLRSLLLALSLLPAIGLLAQEPSVAVTVAPLSELLAEQELHAPARVVSANRSQLAAEVTATVQEVHADVGGRVQKGELLVLLDTTDHELALASAEASLAAARARQEQARLRLERARSLSTSQYISADDLLGRETDLQVIQAELRGLEVQQRIARRNLEKCRITAPFDGVVASRSANLGALAVPGSPMMTLVETDAVELEAELPAAHAASLADSPRMEALLVSGRYSVVLDRLSGVIQEDARNRLARLRFSGELPPAGDSGQLRWQAARGLLPAGLLVRRGNDLGVFLAENGRARYQVIPEAQEGRPASVNLPADSLLVVSGRERLQDGQAIRTSPVSGN